MIQMWLLFSTYILLANEDEDAPWEVDNFFFLEHMKMIGGKKKKKRNKGNDNLNSEWPLYKARTIFNIN